MTIQKRFIQYLLSLPLTEQFFFSEEYEGVSFHWSNWDTFCGIISKYPDFEERRNSLIEEIESKVAPLKNETIWINSAEKTTESNMYELYSLYLDSRVRDEFFHSEKQVLYSEGNSSGPFHSITSLKWKNKEIYKLFMLGKILRGACPLRRFRLNMDMDVAINFDKFPLRNSIAQIEQVTEYGFILRCAGSKDFFCLTNSNRIKIKLKVSDLNDLYESKNINVPAGETELEVYFTPEVLEKYGNKRNFTHSREDQIFIFIGFGDLNSSPSSEEFINFFTEILNDSKKLMEEMLTELLPSFHSGVKRVS